MPTTRGWLVTVAGTALLALGVASQYQELALLGGLALVSVLVSVLLVGRPAGVATRRSIPGTRTSPGSTVRVRLRTRNSGSRSLRVSERVLGTDGEQAVPLDSLAGGAAGESDYWLQPLRRGVVDLGPVRAGRSDPFGLADAERGCGGVERLWVHPRWEYLRTVPVGRVADPDGEVDGARAGTLTFHTLRDYVPGDDLRHVHWRSSARLDRLVVREYVDTSQTRLCVIVDDRLTSGGDARFDEVASAAASVLATGVRASLHCELRLVSGRGRDGTGGLSPLLDLLAEAGPEPEADLPSALRLARSRMDGDTVVLVSGNLTATDLGLFGQLGDRYAALTAAVVGPAGSPSAPPSVTLITAGDASAFADRWNEAPWPR